jgi:Uma2 family endonuclease
MSASAVARMLPDKFLEWGLHQELRYELVDGIPYAMAGAKQRHDRIVANTHGLLFGLLRGHRCRNFTADIAVRIPAGNIRRPDAGIDCARFDENASAAGAPYLVIEVLSPSTRQLDLVRKLEEYKTVPSMAHIVILDPDIAEALHWARASGEDWHHTTLEGLEAVIGLPEIGRALDLATLYEGLTFQPGPRVVVNT